AVSEVSVIVPRNEPSCATAVTMRNGIPVSDALRYDRPSHVPAYFRAGPPGAPDLSLGAHALRTTAAHSSLRMLDLRYVLGMEYERWDRSTQGTARGPRRRVATRTPRAPPRPSRTARSPAPPAPCPSPAETSRARSSRLRRARPLCPCPAPGACASAPTPAPRRQVLHWRGTRHSAARGAARSPPRSGS